MNKNRLNVLVDILSYVAIVGLAGTGLLLAYRLPPGSYGRAALGWGRHDWGDVHFYLAASLAVLMLLHVVLHWQWVMHCVGRALVLVLGLVTAAALAAPWCLSVTDGSGEGHRYGQAKSAEKGQGKQAGRKGKAKDGDACSVDGEATPGEEGHGEGQAIRGRTTLAEAAEYAGVPVARLLAELGLPANTSPNDTLGVHGFRQDRVAEVREIIERLRKPAAQTPPAEGTQ